MADALSGPTLGALCALGSAMTWAVTSLLVRRLSASCSMMTINAVRISASTVIILVAVIVGPGAGTLAAVSGMNLLLIVGSIIVAAGIGDSIFFESTRVIGLAPAMSISTTYPLYAGILAAVVLDEPVTGRAVLGAVITLGGLVVILISRDRTVAPHRHRWLGVGAAFGAGVTWALSAILIKPALRDVSALTAQALRMPAVAVFLWLLPWSRRGVPALRAAGPAMTGALVAMGGLTAVSSLMFVVGIKYASVMVATVLSSTAPMFALALGALFLSERITAGAVVGTAVTVAGIVVLKV